MDKRKKIAGIGAAAVAIGIGSFFAVSAASAAHSITASKTNPVYWTCQNKSTGAQTAIRIYDGSNQYPVCGGNYNKLWWSQQGSEGTAGPAGPAGPQGDKGDTGATGAAGADGVSGYAKVDSDAVSIDQTSGDVKTMVACPAGTVVLGGGVAPGSGGAFLNVHGSYPGGAYDASSPSRPTAWTTYVSATDAATYRVWAVCAAAN